MKVWPYAAFGIIDILWCDLSFNSQLGLESHAIGWRQKAIQMISPDLLQCMLREGLPRWQLLWYQPRLEPYHNEGNGSTAIPGHNLPLAAIGIYTLFDGSGSIPDLLWEQWVSGN